MVSAKPEMAPRFVADPSADCRERKGPNRQGGIVETLDSAAATED